jgi:hypothetical protein
VSHEEHILKLLGLKPFVTDQLLGVLCSTQIVIVGKHTLPVLAALALKYPRLRDWSSRLTSLQLQTLRSQDLLLQALEARDFWL